MMKHLTFSFVVQELFVALTGTRNHIMHLEVNVLHVLVCYELAYVVFLKSTFYSVI